MSRRVEEINVSGQDGKGGFMDVKEAFSLVWSGSKDHLYSCPQELVALVFQFRFENKTDMT